MPKPRGVTALWACVAGALLAFCTMPLAVQAQPAPAALSAPRAPAEELATLILQPESMPARVEGLLSDAMAAFLRQDEGIRDMEKTYPGLLRAVGAAMRPILAREMERNLPLYHADLAALYSDNLSIDQIREADAFWRGPVGTRVRTSVTNNMRYSSIIQELTKIDSVSAESVRSDVQRAASDTVSTLTPHERLAVQSFYVSTVGQRMLAINDRKLAIDAKWANYISPQGSLEVEKAVMGAIVGHIAKTDPATAKLMRTELAKSKKTSE